MCLSCNFISRSASSALHEVNSSFLKKENASLKFYKRLKVHKHRFGNFPICSGSYVNNTLKINILNPKNFLFIYQ